MAEQAIQIEIHEKSLSSDPANRVEAAKQLGWKYEKLPDKNQAWSDLIRLANDEIQDVYEWASLELGSIFIEVPDKDRAWQDLHTLSCNANAKVKGGVAKALGKVFVHIPDKFKHEAWCDLHQLIIDENSEVRRRAINALISAYPHILNDDKPETWSDLHRCTNDNDPNVKKEATETLGYTLSYISNVSEAWSDLHRLTGDNRIYVRRTASIALGKAFPHVPDKTQAWLDLHRLAQDNNYDVRRCAVWSIGLSYSEIPKMYGSEAWLDIHRLTKDDEGAVRENATVAIILSIKDIPNKSEVWSDIHQLSHDIYKKVRWRAAGAIGAAFLHIPDKDQSQALTDLHRLAVDANRDVRRVCARVFGDIFPYLLEKDLAWKDLVNLAEDKDSYVRTYAYYSLGKSSVFKATEAEDDDTFKQELKDAVEYFEKSSQEKAIGSPAKFCHPFYRSYYVLTCKKDSSEAEIEKYLAEAKVTSEGSKSKEELLEAVENLANALREVQRLHETNLDGVKSDLKAYMRYCNRAAELLDNTEERAPGATKLVRRGLPIIDRQIKETIAEVQEKARAICQQTRGTDTPFEQLGFELNRQAGALSDSTYLKSARSCLRMSKIMRDLCKLLPPDKRGLACEIIDEINEDNELGDNLSKLETALGYIQPNIELEAYEGKTTQIMEEMNGKLDNIIYNISRIKIHSADAADGLRALKWELDRVKAIKSDVEGLGRKVEDLDGSQQQVLLGLEEQMPRIIGELETLAEGQDEPMIPEVLEKLDGLKRSRRETVFERASGLASIVGLLLTLAL